jgi:predicted alpha/beta superfamily hydrolase
MIHRHANFASQFIAPRQVDVWCPPDYATNEQQRYPVIYMHDGQNLFAPSLAFGGVDWGVDEALTRLVETKGLPSAIVVGVWNTAIRRCEYMPQKPYEISQSPAAKAEFVRENGGPSISDRYLKFLVEELKPFIDARYHTLPDQPHTLVAGSSMGGLISLYAISEYPQVFGGAACLSTHWPIGGEPLVLHMAAALPDPATHKLYFDFGTETLDADYEPYQRMMDACLRQAGYVEDKNWMTLKFDGAEHSEKSWRERVEIPLAFLLK